MKKAFLFLAVISALLLSGCADSKTLTVNGKEVTAKPYGWANSDARKIEGVEYELSAGNVILSLIFSESVIIPVYLTGWELFEPVGTKTSTNTDKIGLIEEKK